MLAPAVVHATHRLPVRVQHLIAIHNAMRTRTAAARECMSISRAPPQRAKEWRTVRVLCLVAGIVLSLLLTARVPSNDTIRSTYHHNTHRPSRLCVDDSHVSPGSYDFRTRPYPSNAAQAGYQVTWPEAVHSEDKSGFWTMRVREHRCARRWRHARVPSWRHPRGKHQRHPGGPGNRRAHGGHKTRHAHVCGQPHRL